MTSKTVWTLHYGEPAPGTVVGQTKRYGKVAIEVKRGRARIPIRLEESPGDLYATYAQARAARQRIAVEGALKEVRLRKAKFRAAREDLLRDARYNKKVVSKALASLRTAERALKKVRRG